MPTTLTFAQGAGVSVPYLTAARALFQKAMATAGEWLLVHGGSGGVGTAAIQMAKVEGLTVIATAGSDKINVTPGAYSDSAVSTGSKL